MSIFKRDTGKWVSQTSYYDKNGKRKYRTRTFTTRREASVFDAQQIQDAEMETGSIPQDISIANYFDQWVATYKKPAVSANTLLKYVTSGNTIREYFRDKKLKDLNRIEYQKFLNWYADDGFGHRHSKESVEKLHVHAHAAIRAAYDDGYLKQDIANRPTIGGKQGKKDSLKFLEAADFERLRDYVNQFASPDRLSLMMIQTAIYSGARLSEIAGLTFDDVDEKAGTLDINKNYDYVVPDNTFKPTKTASSTRVIDVSPILVKSLHKLILAQRVRAKVNPDSLVFAGLDGTPPTSNGVNKELRRAMAHLQIEKDGFTFHGLRHSHASYLLASGVDLQYVSKRLGHDNIGITAKTYTHILDRLEKREIQKMLEVLK
ncbi:MAG: tyrosine-type recombinase/integrase [Schleiferilactobacillus perolens]|uniref:tyrosine-type recombinase/integrase n=1 Tax=Schleiferilactobacillus perolens TaxID=100468 RepID=UPI0039EAA845